MWLTGSLNHLAFIIIFQKIIIITWVESCWLKYDILQKATLQNSDVSYCCFKRNGSLGLIEMNKLSWGLSYDWITRFSYHGAVTDADNLLWVLLWDHTTKLWNKNTLFNCFSIRALRKSFLLKLMYMTQMSKKSSRCRRSAEEPVKLQVSSG